MNIASIRSQLRFLTFSLVAAVLLASASLTAHAQYRTSVQGVVTDSTGAVIPNAKLTLKDNQNNATIVHMSDAAGVFNFNALPADTFTLTVESAGFQKKTLSNLQFIPEQPNSLTVKLAVGGASDTVTVDASTTPAVDTETANIGGTISSNDIQHLPSFNRDVFTLTQLTPGVISDGSQSGGGGVYNYNGNQGPGGSGNGGAAPTENGPQANANGGQYETNSISIDGISTVSAVWGGTTIITPTEESIDNVRIVTNDYDAENGRFSGAQTMVTSKSGTNKIHGSAFISIHRPGLNAFQHAIVNTPTGTTSPLRDEQRFNQYGGSFGGPILKDRIFAFFAYESSPNKTTATSQGWYDTPAFDGLSRSGSIANTYLTFPGAGVVNTGIIDKTCAGAGLVEGSTCHYIPGQGLNIGTPLTTALGTQDPTATGTATTPGVGSGLGTVADIAFYNSTSPFTSYYRQYNGRMDADATKKDHLSFAIYWVPQGNTQYNGGDRQYNIFYHQQINDAFSVIWNHTFSPTFLNEARANAAGWRWNEIASNPQQPVGLPDDQVDTIGTISLNQFGSSLGSDINQWTYGYKDVATKILHQQTIKFGADFTQLHYLNYPVYTYRPTYNFYDIWDFLNDAPREEVGNFNPATGFPGGERQDDRENLFGAFVQDDWKILPNLTLHAGMRYSYFGPLYDKQNDIGVVGFGAGSDMLTGVSVHTGGNVWNAQKFNLGPQIGFNWSPESFHNKLTVRGGYGLTYNQEEIAISANGSGNPPGTFNADFRYASPSNQGTNGADILYGISSSPTNLNGFASNPYTIGTLTNSQGIPLQGNANLVAYPSKLPTAYAQHYSLDTEYEVGNYLVASLGYEGSVSRHLIAQYNANATAIGQGIALNPLVTGVSYFDNEGSANNNALLAELKHPFSHHYSLDAQFMWAKSMDETSGPYSEGPYPNTPSYNYGQSDYNIGKSLKIFGLWQPVLFHGNHSFLEKVAGGWSLSGIFNIHTGFPWTPTYYAPQSFYCSNCGYSALYPAFLGGGKRSGNSNHDFEYGNSFPNYANVAAAAVAPTATVNGSANTVVAYSNADFSVPNFEAAMTGTFPGVNAALPPAPGLGRNSFTGPGYRDVDASLSKAFGLPNTRILGDAAKLEIRADAFNIFNNTNLNPQSITTDITSPNFGQDTTILGSRTVSFEARFSF